ncbi:MAG: T9SS type A sorting domain-containing protein [Saprospiraceae bacterium]|nr:T9SS type A sorting domain-containing protein [Saprospiraceae bacterium]
MKSTAQSYNDYYDFLEDYYTNFVYQLPDSFERGEQTLIERDALTWAPRVYPTRGFNEAYRAHYDYVNGFNSYGRFGGGTCPFIPPLTAPWNQLGPVANGQNIGIAGQIHRITFHPSYDAVTNQKMYACSGFGGLWKSDDGANSWNLMNTDNTLPFCGVADVAVCENSGLDWVYIATGYPDGNIYGTVSPNVSTVNPLFTEGVYRTNNNGATWDPVDGGLMLNFQNGGVIRRIKVNLSDPNNLIIASSQGIFYSTDASNALPSWTESTIGGNPIVDPELRGLEFNTLNPNVVYASGTDIYRSSDAGVTWTSMTGTGTGLDFSLLAANYGGFQPKRINIATTSTNSDLVYAYIVGTDRMFLFQFDENTGLWTQRLTHFSNSVLEAYSPSYMAIAVDEQSPNFVYYGNAKVRRVDVTLTNPASIDFSGYVYANTGGKYVDIHALVFDPVNHSLFVGHHGGISKYNFNNSTWTFQNVGICNNIIWSFDDNETDKEELIAAFQDQGIKTIQEIAGNTTWYHTNYTGDGFSSRIYDDFNKRAYISSGHPILDNYNFITQSWVNIAGGFPVDIPDPGSFPPIFFPKTFSTELHPLTHEPYSGFSEIYRHINPPASTWELESDIGKTITLKWHRQITELQISRSNPDIVYVATMGVDNGTDPTTNWDLDPHLFKSSTGFQNGVINWGVDHFLEIDLLANGIPPYSGNVVLPAISGIAVNPADANNVFISFTGFSDIHKVWGSNDGGLTWFNADPNGCLLNLPVNGIVYQDGTDDRLYIATDRGVYTKDNSSDWTEYGDLPNVRVVELKINYCNNSIKVATFGRGIFEADLFPSSGLNSDLIINSSTTWTFDRFETGNIRVTNGAVLTIQSTLMMPFNGKIYIEDGCTLHLDGATLTNGCEKMWDGIYLLGNGSVFLMENNSTIENSINGVNSFNGASITTMTNSVFNKNLVSIRIHPYSSPHPAIVTATTFTCVDAASNPTLLNYPYNTQRSYKAIDILDNRQVNIGNNGLLAYRNNFYYHDHGIYAFRSNLEVVNCNFVFVDDVLFPEDPNLITGTAIYSESEKPYPRNLVVGGYTLDANGDNTSLVSFRDCKRSILAFKHISTDIQYTQCDFNSYTAIDIQFGYSQPHYLFGNKITDSNVGINLYECQNSTSSVITKNEYILGGNSGTPTYLRRGIYVDNVLASLMNLTISNNYVEGARIGIRCRFVNLPIIINNIVYPQLTGGTTSKFGIYLTRCEWARVFNNTVTRTANIPIQRIQSMIGIRIDGCKSGTIQENTTIGMGKGHYCFGNSAATYYTCNTMDNCLEGLFMDAATLPPQGTATFPLGNKWINMGSGPGGNLRVSGIAAVPVSYYHPGLLLDPANDQSPYPFDFLAINAFPASGTGPCPNQEEPPREREQAFGLIVTDNTNYQFLEPENEYFDKDYLYKLTTDEDFINQGLPDDNIYQAFYDNYSSTNISNFQEAIELTLSGSVNSALTLNNSIVDNNIIEFNKKTCLDIYLQTLAINDSLDSLQISIIEPIAWQTFAIGGEGVIMARALLHLEIDDVSGLSFRKSDPENSIISNIFVYCYPNPFTDAVNVRSLDTASDINEFKMYDSKGKLVFKNNFTSYNYKVELGHLNSGIYTIEIISNSKIIYSNKIVKQ